MPGAKHDALYLTEAEIAARVGLSLQEWDAVASKLERVGLPTTDPVFKSRRYWPAVKAYLDRRNGLPQAANSAAGVVALGPRKQGSLA